MMPRFHLVLASQSPRRIQLLRQIGWDFEIVPSNLEEKWEPHWPPIETARQLAVQKARDVANHQLSRDVLILAADTIVIIDNKILGKPSTPDEAFAFLNRLSGRSHQVVTGVCLISPLHPQPIVEDVMTCVWFSHLENQLIAEYIRAHTPFDKAGGYGIQDRGALFIERIDGCFFNVMGLPLNRVYQMFKDNQLLRHLS